jgi:hypothetical protein
MHRIGRRVIEVTQPSYNHTLTPAVKMHGGLHAIAAIVARSTRYPNQLGVRRYRERQFGYSQTCSLHQCVLWQHTLRLQFNSAGSRDAIQRPWG